jgi:hypothetical protein
MSRPSTFAEWLAGRSDAQLLAVLTARPDVSVPPPADFDVLARRLSSSGSVGRAKERVDSFGWEIISALALIGRPVSVVELAEAGRVGVDQLEPELERLRALAFVWGDEQLELPRGVADELGPYPLGLGRPAIDLLRGELAVDERPVLCANLGIDPGRGTGLNALIKFYEDPGRLDALLAGIDEPERKLLEGLADRAPVGSTGAPVRVPLAAEATTAIGRLLARGLLLPAGADLVEMPREVSLALRRLRAGGSGGGPGDATEGSSTAVGGLAELLGGQLHPDPPALGGRRLAADDVDGAAATAAGDLLRRLDTLLDRWDDDPPVLTRSGGLPVRELRAAAKDLELPPDTVAVLAELLRATALVAERPGGDASVALTEYVDDWRALSNAQRWAAVAAAWLDLEAQPGLATSVQPERPQLDGDGPAKPVPVFSWDLRRPGAAAARREVLEILADAPNGTSADAAAVLDQLAWQGPRRNPSWWGAVVRWTLSEAELLGVTGRGALGSAGRAVLRSGRAPAAAAMDRHLPAPVDHLLIQGDLTAIAPGPLEPALAREIGLVADVESAGAATVFRFSEGSIRRALDAGRSGADVQALITRTARGTVPQSLTYLVDDVARRHGRLRVGSISSYLRCDDPALLAEVAAARRTGSVDLRLVAPTVAVSSAPLDRVLEVLRVAGYAPASESPDGQVRIERSATERVPVPARRPLVSGSTGIPRDHLSATVVRLRRAETVAAAARSRPNRSAVVGEPVRSTGAVLKALNVVVEQGGAVEISYIDLDGRSNTRVVHPLLLSGGYLTAYDEQTGSRSTFAVSRISSLAVLEDR